MKTYVQLLDQLLACMRDLLSHVRSGQIVSEDAVHKASMEYDQIKKDRESLDA